MLGHLIYNHNQLDDLRIQEEISKKLYAGKFGGVYLVHAYNGENSFGYKKYLEDKLISRKNKGHFSGAADLIDAGLQFFNNRKTEDLRYILVTAADTWLINTEFLEKLTARMEKEGKILAASSWLNAVGQKPNGFSTDFFVIDIKWNRKHGLFPMHYDEFVKRFDDLYALQYSSPLVEKCVQYRFQKIFMKEYQDNETWRQREAAFRRITEREPIHIGPAHKEAYSGIGLYAFGDPRKKRNLLKKNKLDVGKYSHKLISSKDLKYYNKTN